MLRHSNSSSRALQPLIDGDLAHHAVVDRVVPSHRWAPEPGTVHDVEQVVHAHRPGLVGERGRRFDDVVDTGQPPDQRSCILLAAIERLGQASLTRGGSH